MTQRQPLLGQQRDRHRTGTVTDRRVRRHPTTIGAQPSHTPTTESGELRRRALRAPLRHPVVVVMRTTNTLEVPRTRGAAQTLPAQPLIELIRGRGGLAAALEHLADDPDLVNALQIAYHRAQTDGTVTVAKADEFAIKVLGYHPILIFGDDWLIKGDERPPHDRRYGPNPSNSGYNRGCRCFDCNDAHVTYAAQRRAVKLAAKAVAAEQAAAAPTDVHCD